MSGGVKDTDTLGATPLFAELVFYGAHNYGNHAYCGRCGAMCGREGCMTCDESGKVDGEACGDCLGGERFWCDECGEIEGWLPAAPSPRPCSPSSFIADVLRKDAAAVKELETVLPEYTPPPEYTALQTRGKEVLGVLDEMTALLRSAICICERQGQGTNWEGFAASIRELGLTGVTARTYREANVEAIHGEKGATK